MKAQLDQSQQAPVLTARLVPKSPSKSAPPGLNKAVQRLEAELKCSHDERSYLRGKLKETEQVCKETCKGTVASCATEVAELMQEIRQLEQRLVESSKEARKKAVESSKEVRRKAAEAHSFKEHQMLDSNLEITRKSNAKTAAKELELQDLRAQYRGVIDENLAVRQQLEKSQLVSADNASQLETDIATTLAELDAVRTELSEVKQQLRNAQRDGLAEKSLFAQTRMHIEGSQQNMKVTPRLR